MKLNHLRHPCGCRVFRWRRGRWLPAETCRFHDSPGLDYLRGMKGRVTR